MPIQSYVSFQCMTAFCRTSVPEQIWTQLTPIKDNDEAVKQYGTELCYKMCQELHRNGIPGFHFYTLNLEQSVLSTLKSLGFQEIATAKR